MEEGISSISGLMTQRLGSFPAEGDKIILGEYNMEVMETDGPKVEKVRLSKRRESDSVRELEADVV